MPGSHGGIGRNVADHHQLARADSPSHPAVAMGIVRRPRSENALGVIRVQPGAGHFRDRFPGVRLCHSGPGHAVAAAAHRLFAHLHKQGRFFGRMHQDTVALAHETARPRHAGQLGLERLSLRDVADDADEPAGLALVVAHRGDQQFTPEHRAILAHIAFFDGRSARFSGDGAAAQLLRGVDILGKSNVRRAHPQQLRFAITEHFAQAPVDHENTPVEPGVGNAGGGLIEGHPEALFTLPLRADRRRAQSQESLQAHQQFCLDERHSQDIVEATLDPRCRVGFRTSHHQNRQQERRRLALHLQQALGMALGMDFIGDDEAAVVDVAQGLFRDPEHDHAVAHRTQKVAQYLRIDRVAHQQSDRRAGGQVVRDHAASRLGIGITALLNWTAHSPQRGATRCCKLCLAT